MTPAILLVDDDQDDIMLLKDALFSVNKDCRITEATDGLKALALLKEARNLHTLPNLIVMDISMAVLNGKELLAILKSEEGLKDLPVVIFTTSNNIADINYCKKFKVDLITKPSEAQALYSTAARLLTYCRL